MNELVKVPDDFDEDLKKVSSLLDSIVADYSSGGEPTEEQLKESKQALLEFRSKILKLLGEEDEQSRNYNDR